MSLSTCPVCHLRLGVVRDDGSRCPEVEVHLASHSKEEVLRALIQQREREQQLHQHSASFNSPFRSPALPAENAGIHFMAGSSAVADPSSLRILLGGKEALPGTFLMPHMMGMMQVMTSPCLIPQANGPPLLVNMPSYLYPNLNGVMPGGFPPSAPPQSPLAAAHFHSQHTPISTSTSPSLTPFPCFPPPFIMPETERALHAQELPHQPPKHQVWQEALRPEVPNANLLNQNTPLRGSSSKSIRKSKNNVAEKKTRMTEHNRHSAPRSPPKVSSIVETSCSPKLNTEEALKPPLPNPEVKASSPVPGPSRPMAQSEPRRPFFASGPIKLKIKNLRDFEEKFAASSSQPISSTQESSHSSEVSTVKDVDDKSTDIRRKSTFSVTDPPVSGFTQYAADRPYPAASLNFSSILLHSSAKNEGSTPARPSEEQKLEVEDKASSRKSVVAGSVEVTSEGNSDNVCTVQTVADLQNALQSDNDIQIVVPNELLETSEFKSFISTLNSFPLHESRLPKHAYSSDAGEKLGDEIIVPHNTPNTSRPPSAQSDIGEESNSNFTPEGQTEVLIVNTESIQKHEDLEADEEDLNLQDLVAVETMDEGDDTCEGDQFFTLTPSTNPLEPFMNSIFQSQEPASFCEKCNLHFKTVAEFRKHRDVNPGCGYPLKGIGKKSTNKSKIKNASFSKSAMNVNETTAIEQDNKSDVKEFVFESVSEDDPVITEIKPEIKSEVLDSSSQPALAATGKYWKCHQCKVVFETGPQLMEHLETIRNSEFKCMSCHLGFDDRKTLLLHRKQIHPSLGKIKLENPALASASSSRAPSPSLLVANENGDFVCDKCDRAFKEKDLLIKHMSCHDEDRPFECLVCGKKFTKASLLRDHRRRHFDAGAFECDVCHKRFYTPSKLREHLRVHTGEAPLACNVCGKTFRRHSNLSEHKRIHQPDRPVKPPKELFCHCGKVFHTQRDLDWHKEGEHDRQPKKCTYCGEVFVHSSSLTRHIRLKHEANFVPENKKSSLYANCPICHQTFYKTSIKKHIRIKHQGQKPYTCDVCKASFVTKCNLLNHQWQHRGIRSRPFKCHLCKKAYLRQNLLDAHMRSHRGLKPFVCNDCGMQFANKSNWQRHVVEHTGARNYECSRCPKKFSRRYYLTDHLKTHTGEKPFVCGICGKMAATRSNYNSHLKTHITREPVNSEV